MVLNPIARRAVGAATLATAMILPACGGPAASSGKMQVVASFYPIAEAAQEVGSGFVAVTDLTAPGVEPHDLELTPRELQDIAQADVVLYLGGGFQPAVKDAMGEARGVAVDVGARIHRLPAPPGSEAGLTSDPHVWLDPVLYRQIVGVVASALSKADPSKRQTFERNAGAFEARISALDAAYRSGLAGCARDVIVTSHAAFGYLAQRYGLRQESISGLSPDAEPTPQHLAQLKAIVQRDGVTTIFTEELTSPKVADTLAQETGATTEVLSPLESLTPQEVAAGQDYLSVMRSNLTKLEAALGCG
jgi:zinc transport system substrate-binding protein